MQTEDVARKLELPRGGGQHEDQTEIAADFMTTQEQIRFERIAAFMTSIMAGGQDVRTMHKFIEETSHVASGMNHTQLRQDFSHYLTLKQRAAKEAAWAEVLRYAHKVDVEVSWAKSRMETGGTGVQ